MFRALNIAVGRIVTINEDGLKTYRDYDGRGRQEPRVSSLAPPQLPKTSIRPRPPHSFTGTEARAGNRRPPRDRRSSAALTTPDVKKVRAAVEEYAAGEGRPGPADRGQARRDEAVDAVGECSRPWLSASWKPEKALALPSAASRRPRPVPQFCKVEEIRMDGRTPRQIRSPLRRGRGPFGRCLRACPSGRDSRSWHHHGHAAREQQMTTCRP